MCNTHPSGGSGATTAAVAANIASVRARLPNNDASSDGSGKDIGSSVVIESEVEAI